MESRPQPSTSLPSATATTPPIYPWRMSRGARLGWLLPTRGSPWSQSTAGRCACWCHTCTSGRVPSGSGDCSSLPTTSPASGRPWATTTTGTPGASSATGETKAVAVQPRRIRWRLVEIIEVVAVVCGPTSFVEGVADALVRLGHDPAREDRTFRTHRRLENYGRAQAGRQRCSWHPRGDLLLRGNHRALRLRGLRKGRAHRRSYGVHDQDRHHRPLP